MQIQLIMGLVIAGLVVVYLWLRRNGKTSAMPNLPAVSEDVNLPVASQSNLSEKNELENNGSQQ